LIQKLRAQRAKKKNWSIGKNWSTVTEVLQFFFWLAALATVTAVSMLQFFFARNFCINAPIFLLARCAHNCCINAPIFLLARWAHNQFFFWLASFATSIIVPIVGLARCARLLYDCSNFSSGSLRSQLLYDCSNFPSWFALLATSVWLTPLTLLLWLATSVLLL